MPTYDYLCEKCEAVYEYRHSMFESPEYKCKKCKKTLNRQIPSTFYVAKSFHFGKTIEERKESEHKKKVKDLDRAVRNRRKHFGSDAVGVPTDKPDPKHIIKKGRTLGGKDMEIDKQEFIKAAAKDPVMVKKAQDSVAKAESKKRKTKI